MDLIDGISNLENFGIDLKLQNYEAEAFYCEALRQWFEKEKGFYAEAITDREFSLNMGFGELSIVYIEDSVLRMKPIMDDPYEVLICLLEFIADNHHKTIEVYNYLEENEEEILGWPKSNFYKKQTEEVEEEKEEVSEEESDEWI